MSTFDVASMLEVDPGSVANWIDSGRLKAYRTPGGHRRVSDEDLLAFLRQHNMPIPQRLVQKTVKIVIVDDEPAITEMVARAIGLSHPEYQIHQAHDGFQAGSMIATLRPDVVILDLRMPGMDGFSVCRQIKEQEQTRHAAVVAMTAYPSPEAEAEILRCGAKACLAKPLDFGRLVQKVEALAK